MASDHGSESRQTNGAFDRVDRAIPASPRPPRPASDFLAGGGEMGALMRAKDWADTPLGPPGEWPQSLKTMVRVLLTSRYQMWMGWGDTLTFFYNDAYRPTLGLKHGWALGASAREVWKEIWPDIGPRIERVLTSGDATWDDGLMLFLERSGYPEETYHTFSYSPLADDAGVVVGMLCVVTEETERIIGARRLSSLSTLASGIAGKNTRDEVFAAAGTSLAANTRDLPFTLTYVYDAQRRLLHRACASGTAADDAIAPITIDPEDDDAPWPATMLESHRDAFVLHDIDRRFAQAPTGAWNRRPRQAVVVPIARQGQLDPAGFLIAAANPFRPLDAAYLGFMNLIAGQIASGLANADAYEDARRRAEALAELDRAKTAFFSNVSHEFRTPLTLMLGPLEDVLSRSDAVPLSDHRSLVEVAHRNGVRLLKLVNTLLDFSRIEAGRVRASFQPVDLGALTRDLASGFQSAIDLAGLSLVLRTSPLPQPVHVDPDMWEKIVLNLLSNAFKFTFDGTITVEVAAGDDGAVVTVSDTGVGIPASELPHVFERFRRVENARGRSIEGSGIGLALVQELVRLHGGAIRVASQPGLGSAFTVEIPFGIAHLPQDQLGATPEGATSRLRTQAYIDEAIGWLHQIDDGDGAERPAASSPEDIGPVRPLDGAAGKLVLLADDNADMRTYLQRVLLGAGLRVEAVTDGAQAIAAARVLKPDLVLSDVMMPGLDGFGLLAALRRNPDLRDTPILLLSARAGEEAKVEGLAAGADDYLTKPFSARELLARVRANLDMAALRRAALRVENELRQQAQHARETAEGILASINDGFFTLDRDWRFTYVNAAAERLLSRAAETLVGAVFWEAYPELRSGELEQFFAHAMAERATAAFEIQYRPLERWFDIRVYPARDGGLSIYFQDVTERRQIQDALRRLNESLENEVTARTRELRSKEARLRTIFETSFAYQGLLDLDGTVLDANATALAGIGARLEDVLGKKFWTLRWFATTPGMAERVREAIPIVAAGETLRQEIHVDMPVGGWRWFEFQMRPIHDQHGNVAAILPEAVDITDRRAAEEALRQVQKMESIGQLTGGVAHDFNNLLTIIIGNLETIQRLLRAQGTPLAAFERPVDHAMRGAQRAASLTQRLLAFSRRQPLDPKPVDVSRLVTGISDLLRRTIGEQIAVETVLAGGLWRVNIDANQLEMAILNLTVNARDAMPGGGKLTIETANAALDERYSAEQAEVMPGQYVMIAVTDNGIGMSRETASKAFEPFFTTKDIGHGTGLGLSQVYGFVKQSGGHVKIYSEVGDGTTVKIYLPRFHADEQAMTEEPATPLARGRLDETILVVEDDDDVRAHSCAILRELGYRVIEAGHGAAALELLARHPEISLLFTDVGLPGGMNGRQLADFVRVKRPDLKILFTTGYARNAIVHEGRLDPGVQLITKPFNYVALAGKLRDLLDAPAAPRRVLVVEDDALVRMLAVDEFERLGFEVETAATAAEARAKLRRRAGDVTAAMIDVGLPDIRGSALARELRATYPGLRMLIASGYDVREIRAALGDDPLLGFLAKPYTAPDLRKALAGIGVAT